MFLLVPLALRQLWSAPAFLWSFSHWAADDSAGTTWQRSQPQLGTWLHHHPQGCIQPPQRHQKTSEDGGLCVGAEVCGADGEEERVRGWYLCCWSPWQYWRCTYLGLPNKQSRTQDSGVPHKSHTSCVAQALRTWRVTLSSPADLPENIFWLVSESGHEWK